MGRGVHVRERIREVEEFVIHRDEDRVMTDRLATMRDLAINDHRMIPFEGARQPSPG
jgi:hypothetical protein